MDFECATLDVRRCLFTRGYIELIYSCMVDLLSGMIKEPLSFVLDCSEWRQVQWSLCNRELWCVVSSGCKIPMLCT